MIISKVLLFTYVLYFSVALCFGDDGSETLVLVHALFRHGDRTPDKLLCYPNDPFKNEEYFPLGSGQLTKEGKLREYNLGQFLRDRYNTFLGDLYIPHSVEAISTDFDRTKMSLELVLAGLFPPASEEMWNAALSWQPVPFSYQSIFTDKILHPEVACLKFITNYLEEYLESEEVKEIEEKYSDTLKYIGENAGWNSSDLLQTITLYFTLTTEQEWGLTLPSWTEQIYPQPLEEIAATSYLLLTGTTSLKQIVSGFLLEKMIRDTELKILNLTQKKILLYSAHELNVGSFLNTLGVFEPHVPPYGSCVLLEVHQIDGQYGIKVFYENYKNIQNGYLTIPGCEEFCPFDKFISLMQDYLPGFEDICSLL